MAAEQHAGGVAAGIAADDGGDEDDHAGGAVVRVGEQHRETGQQWQVQHHQGGRGGVAGVALRAFTEPPHEHAEHGDQRGEHQPAGPARPRRDEHRGATDHQGQQRDLDACRGERLPHLITAVEDGGADDEREARPVDEQGDDDQRAERQPDTDRGRQVAPGPRRRLDALIDLGRVSGVEDRGGRTVAAAAPDRTYPARTVGSSCAGCRSGT